MVNRHTVFLSALIPLTLGAFACSPKPVYKHGTLTGIHEQAALKADRKACEDSLPHRLPAGLYASTSGNYIYESQSGSASVQSSSARDARAGSHRSSSTPLTTTKAEDVQRRYIFDQCMMSRGWTVTYGKRKVVYDEKIKPAHEQANPGAATPTPPSSAPNPAIDQRR